MSIFSLYVVVVSIIATLSTTVIACSYIPRYNAQSVSTQKDANIKKIEKKESDNDMEIAVCKNLLRKTKNPETAPWACVTVA